MGSNLQARGTFVPSDQTVGFRIFGLLAEVFHNLSTGFEAK
jgi:hypothetical protein